MPRVRRASRTASAAALRPPRTGVRSPASIAASVPVPIAGLLAAVREEDRDVLRAQLQQRAQNGAGPALGAGLEVTAGQDERRDARRLQAEVPGAVRAGHVNSMLAPLAYGAGVSPNGSGVPRWGIRRNPLGGLTWYPLGVL
ncbi:hypothetical protein GCM10022285_17620 [Streptomyces tunisiensis]|uniref:Uncharacterized protein n=1 Tax=Streptomyces tunisiensis TaxID=948699 RepID=A0ABP7Y2R5_9ACTN